MKAVIALMFLSVVSVSLANTDGNKRQERHFGGGILRKLGGFVKNARCRLRHYKTRIGKDGRPKGCTWRCGIGEEEGYDYRYGHICKAPREVIPKGCADVLCLRCARGYYIMEDIFTTGKKCVKKCPGGFANRGRKCIELMHGCRNLACTQCKDGFYAFRRRYWQRSECLEECPLEYGLNKPKTRCVRCNDNRCSDCHDDAMECSVCESSFFRIRGPDGHECTRRCPIGYVEDYTDWFHPSCVKIDTDEDGDEEEEEEEEEEEDKVTGTLPPPPSPPLPSTAGPSPPSPSTAGSSPPSPSTAGPSSPSPSPSTTASIPLPEGCVDQDCMMCIGGYFKLLSSRGAQCLRYCPDGYHALDNTCFRCREVGCKDCKADITRCMACEKRFVAYKKSANSSVQCFSNCPVDTIKKVVDGKETCVPKPKEECSVENCKECVQYGVKSLHNGCVRCKDNFYLKRDIFADRCVLRCPSRFYEGLKPGTDIKACLECSIPLCTECVSAKKCFRCQIPFVVSPKTGLCSICPPDTIYDPIKETCKKDIGPIEASTESPTSIVLPLTPGEEP